MVSMRKRKQVTYNDSDSDFVSDEERVPVARSNKKKTVTKQPAKSTTRKKAKREPTPEEDSSSSAAIETEEEDESEEFEDEEEDEPKKKSTKKKASQQQWTVSRSSTKNNDDDDDEEEKVYDGNSTKKSKIVIPRPKGSPFPDAISPDSLAFMAELAENNERDFMQIKAKEWAAVRKDFIDLCGLIMKDLHEVDPTIRVEEPRQAVYRQHRDLRFSNDKTPYKTNLSASFSRTGRKFMDAGYFLSIRPGNRSIIAAGIWQPGKDALASIRQNIIRNGDLLKEAMSTEAILDVFDGKSGVDIMEDSDKLKNGPKGIEKDHPEIELLKFRSFAISKSFTDEEVVSPGFVDKIMDVLEAVVPFVAVINSWV